MHISSNGGCSYRNQDPNVSLFSLRRPADQLEARNYKHLSDNRKVFFKGLKKKTTPQTVESVLSSFGELSDLKMPFSQSSKKNMGFGHATFVDPAVAARIRQGDIELVVEERKLVVSGYDIFQIKKQMKVLSPQNRQFFRGTSLLNVRTAADSRTESQPALETPQTRLRPSDLLVSEPLLIRMESGADLRYYSSDVPMSASLNRGSAAPRLGELAVHNLYSPRSLVQESTWHSLFRGPMGEHSAESNHSETNLRFNVALPISRDTGDHHPMHRQLPLV